MRSVDKLIDQRLVEIARNLRNTEETITHIAEQLAGLQQFHQALLDEQDELIGAKGRE